MTFVNEKLEDGNSRTVDRQRGIVLSDLGMAPDTPRQLELNIKNDRIIHMDVSRNDRHAGVEYLRSLSSIEEAQYDVEWKILRVHLKGSKDSEKKDIIDLTTEALAVLGYHAKPEKTKSVTVDFSQAHWG